MEKKKKKMSRELKAFLKKYGRFPKKGELKRRRSGTTKRSHSKSKDKKHKLQKTKRSARGSRSRGWIF